MLVFLCPITKETNMSLLISTQTSRPSRMSYGLYIPFPLPRGEFKNFPAVATKICPRCLTPLSIGENITEYRYRKQYYLCSSCYTAALKGYNKQRANSKKAANKARKSYLQEQIPKLMDELKYLVLTGY